MATRIRHVFGNVLRVAIPLDALVVRMVNGEVSKDKQDFYPNTDFPVQIVLRKGGGIKYTFTADVRDDIVSFEDMGTISIGTYQVEILCRNQAGEPCRYMVRSIIQIVDATADAGIEPGIEFNCECYTLDGGIFLALKGEDGVGIQDVNIVTSDEPGGTNTVTIILTDGRTFSFSILNGSGSVDKALDANSPRPLANSVITSRFNELDQSLSGLFSDVDYDTTSKVIRFWDKDKNNVLATLDARPFIKDGMVNSVYISNNTLVITFNTDAGREAIGVPLSSVFNPNNYYTKTQVDNRIRDAVSGMDFTGYYTKQEVNERLMSKLDVDAGMVKNDYIGRDDKLKGEHTTQVVLFAMGEPYDEGITIRVQDGQPVFENGYIICGYGHTSVSLGTPQQHIIYCNAKTNKLWRWNGTEFVQVGGSNDGGGGGYSVAFDNGNVIFSGAIQPTYNNGNIIF